jgi:hypothetical protein
VPAALSTICDFVLARLAARKQQPDTNIQIMVLAAALTLT